MGALDALLASKTASKPKATSGSSSASKPSSALSELLAQKTEEAKPQAPTPAPSVVATPTRVAPGAAAAPRPLVPAFAPVPSSSTPTSPAPITPETPGYVAKKTENRLANLTDQATGAPTYLFAPDQAPPTVGPDSLDAWLYDLRHASDVQTTNPLVALKNKVVSIFGKGVSDIAAGVLSAQQTANTSLELAKSPEPAKKAAGALGMMIAISDIAFAPGNASLEAVNALPEGSKIKQNVVDKGFQTAFDILRNITHGLTVGLNLDPTLQENVDQVGAFGLMILGGHYIAKSINPSHPSVAENALTDLQKHPDQIATQLPQTLHEVLGLKYETNSDGSMKPTPIEQLDAALKKSQKTLVNVTGPENVELNKKILSTAYQTLKDYTIDPERGQAKIDTIVESAKHVIENSKETQPTAIDSVLKERGATQTTEPVKTPGADVSKNNENIITVYHGGTEGEMPKSLHENFFMTTSREEAAQYAKNKYGNAGMVTELKVNKNDLSGPDNALVHKNGEKLYRGTDGVYRPVSLTEEMPKTSKASAKLQSTVFERLSKENPDLVDGPTYKPQNLKENIRKAVNLVEKDKNKAYRIAMGLEEAPKDQTSTAINIALAEKALEDGNRELYADLVRNRSLAQTRRGQEIVAEKGSVSDNSTSRYVKDLVSLRLTKLGNDYLSSLPEKLKNKGKSKGIEVFDKEVAKTKKAIEGKGTLNLVEVQNFLDSLTCK